MAETLTGEPGQFNVREDITDQQRRNAVATLAGRQQEIADSTKANTDSTLALTEAAKTALQPVTFSSTATEELHTSIDAESQKQIGYQEALGKLYETTAAAALSTNKNFADDWDVVIKATNNALDEYAAELWKSGQTYGYGRGGGRGGGGGGGGGGGYVPGVPTPEQLRQQFSDRSPYDTDAALFSRGIADMNPLYDRMEQYMVDHEWVQSGSGNTYFKALNDRFHEVYLSGGSLQQALNVTSALAESFMDRGVNRQQIEDLQADLYAEWIEQWERANAFRPENQIYGPNHPMFGQSPGASGQLYVPPEAPARGTAIERGGYQGGAQPSEQTSMIDPDKVPPSGDTTPSFTTPF